MTNLEAFYRYSMIRRQSTLAAYARLMSNAHSAVGVGDSSPEQPPVPPTPPTPPADDKLKLVIETTTDYKKTGIYSAERNDASKPIIIDWGDGTVEQVDGDVSQKVHEDTSTGTFNVTIENIKSYAASNTNYIWYMETSQNQYTLKEVVSMPNSVKSIGNYAFYTCANLTHVTIGNSVTSIGDRAFATCNKLMSVTFPESMTSIGDWAFLGCRGLTSVVIGNGVTSIGSRAFDECRNLMSFTVGDGNVNYKSVNGLLLSKDGKTLIQGVNGDVTIPESVTSIVQYAFYNYSSLENLSFAGNNVPAGGYQCFYGIANLTDIYMLNVSQSKVTSQLDSNIKDWGLGICRIDGAITYYAVTIHCKDDEIVTIDPTPSGSGS